MALKVTQDAVAALNTMATQLEEQCAALQQGAALLTSAIEENSSGLGRHESSIRSLVTQLSAQTKELKSVKKLSRLLRNSAGVRQKHIEGPGYRTSGFPRSNRLGGGAQASSGARASSSAAQPQTVITDGSHMENGKPKPNVTYCAGEHNYQYTTDDKGRIIHAHAENLQFKEHFGRLSHDPNTLDKLLDDHAGHIFADLFGGSPELDNLVSQAKKVNQVKYRAYERQWAKHLADGHHVELDIYITYDDNARPTGFQIIQVVTDKDGNLLEPLSAPYIENTNDDPF